MVAEAGGGFGEGAGRDQGDFCITQIRQKAGGHDVQIGGDHLLRQDADAEAGFDGCEISRERAAGIGNPEAAFDTCERFRRAFAVDAGLG